MELSEFYDLFWSTLAGADAALASSKEPWAHTNSNSYRGRLVPGSRTYALVNFKERYAGRHTGRGSRDLCTSYYTDHRDDDTWRALVARLEAQGSPVADAEMVIDRSPRRPGPVRAQENRVVRRADQHSRAGAVGHRWPRSHHAVRMRAEAVAPCRVPGAVGVRAPPEGEPGRAVGGPEGAVGNRGGAVGDV
jgi:hypothetical protein